MQVQNEFTFTSHRRMASYDAAAKEQKENLQMRKASLHVKNSERAISYWTTDRR